MVNPSRLIGQKVLIRGVYHHIHACQNFRVVADEQIQILLIECTREGQTAKNFLLVTGDGTEFYVAEGFSGQESAGSDRQAITRGDARPYFI